MSTNGHGHKIDFGARRKTVTVEIPELGETFRLRALSVGQLKLLRDAGPMRFDSPVQQLAMAIVDDQGQRIYTTEEDLANLSEMSATAFQPLIDALNGLHGVTVQATEVVLKNSEASLSTDSASA